MSANQYVDALDRLPMLRQDIECLERELKEKRMSLEFAEQIVADFEAQELTARRVAHVAQVASERICRAYRPRKAPEPINTYQCVEGETYRLVHKPGRSAKGKASKMLWERVE